MNPEELGGLNYPLCLCESYTFKKEDVWRIVKDLNKKLNLPEKPTKKTFDRSWAKLKSDLNPIAKNMPFFSYLLTPERYKVQRTPQWESLYLTIVAKHIKESPFKFADLLAEARSEIFISGQNLYSLTATDKKKENTTNRNLIFEAIKKKKVRIMLCDPANACAIKTWGEDVMRNKELFAEHLAHSIKTLTKWVEKLRTNKIMKGRKNFEVKTTGMVPLSITFMDPSSKTNSGKLIITTATYERKEAEIRPCYLILQKEHPDIFQYYFAAYNWTYKENAKELK